MFGSRREKAFDVASAGKMLANRPENDDAHPWISVERLEGKAELIALRHLDDVERRPIEDDVGALSSRHPVRRESRRAQTEIRARWERSVRSCLVTFAVENVVGRLQVQTRQPLVCA